MPPVQKYNDNEKSSFQAVEVTFYEMNILNEANRYD